MKLIDFYFDYKSKNEKYLVLMEIGTFVEVYGEDTTILNKLFGYKVKQFGVSSRTGFPTSSLNKIGNVLIEEKINYIIIEKNKIDFKTYEALRLALIEDEFDYTDSSLIEPAFDDLILADKEGLKVKIDSMLKMLEPVEEEIIRYRFGIDCDHKTMDELAKMYNLTKERVRMIEARALRKLRSPLRSSEVRRSM